MKSAFTFWDVLLTASLLLGAAAGVQTLSDKFNSDALNPIQKAFGDFQLSDIVFSQLRDNPPKDMRIVLVNIGELDRAGIAKEIEIINQYKPKLIAIDARFLKAKAPEIDSALCAAFSKVENMVVGSKLIANPDPERRENDSIVEPIPLFRPYVQSAFVNIITEGEDYFKTTRDIVPSDHYYKWRAIDTTFERKMIKDTMNMIRKIKYLKKDTMVYSFPTKIAWIYDSNSVKKYLARGKDTEIINFRGNIDTRKEGASPNAKLVYPVLDVEDVMTTNFVPDLIQGNIIIMGFMGANIADNRWEDKFFTPLNSNYIGKAYADMYGVVAHANAVSMILDGDFINEMPEWLNNILSLLIVFFNVFFITYLFFKLKVWYEAFSNIVILMEAAALVFVVLYVFNDYDFKFDVTMPILALFLTGNIVEIYYGMVKPGMEKIGTKFVILRKRKQVTIKP
ncbi:MAG TPA: CHASE2 domain-containing protein [Cytophagaceae bacterium]|jgi:CHASE2 domain-containing sensor protein|nr:CHASE2 domain-containing protein [Cytophagaceae bacterium]